MEQINYYVPIAQVVGTFIAAIGTFIAAISLFFAGYQLFKTARMNRRQTNSQIMLDCVKRYEKIIESFPFEAWSLRFDVDNVPIQREEITKAALRYLNLCSEEFYLRREGYFDEKIARIWDDL
jgi:hypothetical protein